MAAALASGSAADVAERLMRGKVAEALAHAAGSAADARAECPLRHMAAFFSDAPAQQQQQHRDPGSEHPESASEYEGRHRLAAAVSAALQALCAARPPPQSPRRWLGAHFALAAEAAAQQGGREQRRNALGLPQRPCGSAGGEKADTAPRPQAAAGDASSRASSSRPSPQDTAAAEGGAAGVRRGSGSGSWNAQRGEHARAGLQGPVEWGRVGAGQEARRRSGAAEAEVQGGLGASGAQQSAAEPARCPASASPAPAAGGGGRFGDGINLKPQQQQRPYPFHEDCGVDGGVVLDPPVLAAVPCWPGGRRPPPRWGECTLAAPSGGVALSAERGSAPAGPATSGVLFNVLSDDGEWLQVEHEGGTQWAPRAEFDPKALIAAWLEAALEELDALYSGCCAPLAATAHETRLQQPQEEGARYAERAPTMLDWLFTLPAQWATADLGGTFGNFQTWKYNTVRFIELGGSRFHPCDILCPDGQHRPRTSGRTCCAVRNTLEVLQRMRAGVDPAFEPLLWQKYAQWVAGGRKNKRPEPPKVPAAALAKLAAHDAVEGILACFLYTYNLQCPNDLNAMRTLELPSGDGPPGWQLSGLRVTSVKEESRAARAGVMKNDVLLSAGGVPVKDDAEANRLAEHTYIAVVQARCAPRPLQLFGTVNWAMREVPNADGDYATRLRRALSVFKPFIWRLDRFFSEMEKRDAVLFRGMAKVRTARHYTIGTPLVFAQFTSLSEDAKVAWKFAGEDGGTWLSIQVLAAVDVAFVSQFPSERELLLGSNTRVKVAEKPTDDIRSVLDTTNDAVSLVQCGSYGTEEDDDSPRAAVQTVLRQRVIGLKAQQVVFSTFNDTYVEPRVLRKADEAELDLKEAFDEFVASDAQWCVVVGAAGEGKSSALLWLFARALDAPCDKEGRVPLFVSLPLVPDITEEEGWLRRQVTAQLSLDPTGWDALRRREMVVFADSADESGASPEALRERSLAARSELPSASKCCISVREEDMERMMLVPEHLGGTGCTVLFLKQFEDKERRRFCRRVADRAVKRAIELLKGMKCVGEDRNALLRELPGCRPPDEKLADLHDAILRGDKDKVDVLSEECAEAAAKSTFQHLEGLDSGATAHTVHYAMAAEVAHELKPGADNAAVLEASMLRRLRRGAARVDSEVWAKTGASSEPEQVEALMRVAEAVAAALTLAKQWSGRIGDAAEKAAPLYKERWAPVLAQLLPGLPLRTASAEDTASRFALPHRSVQEWLAARWAERAVAEGRGEKAREVLANLRHWAGVSKTAAAAAEQVARAELAAAERAMAEGKERGPAMRDALRARITDLSLAQDREDAAAKLQKTAEECERLYGKDLLLAEALSRHGYCLLERRKFDDGEKVLRRALELRRQLLGPEHIDTLDIQGRVGYALAETGNLPEAETLLTHAHDALAPGCYQRLMCLAYLGILFEKRGEPERALQVKREALEGLERDRGPDHHSTIGALSNYAVTLENQSRWEESLPLRRRQYQSRRKALDQKHVWRSDAARCYAKALHHSGRPAEREEAEKVLRTEGLWEELQKELAQRRTEQRERYRRLGDAGYAALLREGRETAGSMGWCKAEWPQLVPELDEQLRCMEEGRPPFTKIEGEEEDDATGAEQG